MNAILKLSLVAACLSLAGCGPYVATQPVGSTVVVPVSPGPNYVWVHGGWRWNRGTRAYYRTDGYWAPPRAGRTTYVEGNWVQSRRGYRYRNGHWR